MMKKIFIALVRLYQITFSPWVGHQCRFIPTCSNYAIEAFEKHGALKGLWMTAARLARCHPSEEAGTILYLTNSVGAAGVTM